MVLQKNRTTLSTLLVAIIGLASLSIVLSSCQSTTSPAVDPTATGVVEGDSIDTAAIFEDPYFTEPAVHNELFRVLITDDGYFFRQVARENHIERRPDPNGDLEQLAIFRQHSARYNFRDWQLTGTIRARINPNTGTIEHIDFVSGKSPRTWQAGRLFQEDLSRISFNHPGREVLVQEFLIQYEWRIGREPGLSDEESRQRAVEFLRSQVR